MTLAILTKLLKMSSLRALAKQSNSDIQLQIVLDCFTSFAKTEIFNLFLKMAKVQLKILCVFISLFYMSASYSAAAIQNDSQMAKEVLVYINQYRVKHGLHKLTMNPLLSCEATRHSFAMATHAVPFGHDGFSTRMAHLHRKLSGSLSGAENVAYNYKTAKIVTDGWIHSPGHRRNLMGNYNLTGIGIVKDKQGRLYYTQMFLLDNAL